MVNSVIVENNAIDGYGLDNKNESPPVRNSENQENDFRSILSKKTKNSKNHTASKELDSNNTAKLEGKELQLIPGFINQNQNIVKRNHKIANIENRTKEGKKVNNKQHYNGQSNLSNSKKIKDKKITYISNEHKQEKLINKKSEYLQQQIIEDKLNKLTNGKLKELNIKELKINKNENILADNWKTITTNGKDKSKSKIVKHKQQKHLNIVNYDEQFLGKNVKQNEQKSSEAPEENLNMEKNNAKQAKEIGHLIIESKEILKNTNKNNIINFDNSLNKSKTSENIRLMTNNKPKNQPNGNKKQGVTGSRYQSKIVVKTNLKNNKHLQNYFADFQNITKSNAVSGENTKTYEVKEFVKPTEIAKEILKISKNLTDNSNYSARILLKPESLGTLFVKIQVVNNKVNIKLDVEQKEILKALESQVSALKESIEKVGLKTGDISYQLKENLESEDKANYQHREQKNKDNKLMKDFISSFRLNEIELNRND